jgi:hypothetical protein
MADIEPDRILVPFGVNENWPIVTSLYPKMLDGRGNPQTPLAPLLVNLLAVRDTILSIVPELDVIYNAPMLRVNIFSCRHHGEIRCTTTIAGPTSDFRVASRRNTWIVDTISHFPKSFILEFLENMPMDAFLFCDFTTQNSVGKMYTGTVSVPYVVHQESSLVDRYNVKYPHQNSGHVEYSMSWLTSDWIHVHDGTIIWTVQVIGDRELVTFTKVRDVAFRNTIIPKPNVDGITLSSVLGRTPYNTVTYQDKSLSISRMYKLSNFVYIVPELLVDAIISGSMDPMNKTILAPLELYEHARIMISCQKRDEKTFEALAQSVKSYYIKSNCSQRYDPLVIPAIATAAFSVDLVAENVLNANVNDVVGTKRTVVPENFSSPHLGWIPLALAVGSFSTCAAYMRHVAMRARPATVTSPLLVFGLVFCVGVYSYFTRKADPIIVNTVCPSKLFTLAELEDKTLDESSKLTVDGYDEAVPASCCVPKPAAILGVFGLYRRLPVYSCQCHAALHLALRNRLGFALGSPPLEEVQRRYKAALARVLYKLIKLTPSGGFVPIRPVVPFSPTTFALWVSKYPAYKADIFRDAYNKLLNGVVLPSIERSAFVKFEPGFKAEHDFVAPFIPRAIVSYDPTAVVTMGPTYDKYTKIIKSAMAPVVAGDSNRPFVFGGVDRIYHYMSGLTAEEIGDWHRKNIDWLHTHTDDYVLLIMECDGSRFDGHKHAWYKQCHMELEIVLGMPAEAAQLNAKLLHTTTKTICKRKCCLRSTVEFSAKGRQQSGHLNTSIDNSKQNAAIAEDALYQLSKKYVTRCIDGVLGDDNIAYLAVMKRHRMGASHPDFKPEMLQDLMIQVAADHKHDYEVQIHTDVNQASFCSGYFYPVDRWDGSKFVATYVWMPKIGRILYKLGWCHDFQVDPLSHCRSVFFAFEPAMRAIPILRALCSRVMDLTDGHPLTPIPSDYQHKFMPKRISSYSEDSLSFMMQVYSLNPVEVCQLEQFLLSSRPGLIDHPLLDKIIDHDLPCNKMTRQYSGLTRVNKFHWLRSLFMDGAKYLGNAWKFLRPEPVAEVVGSMTWFTMLWNSRRVTQLGSLGIDAFLSIPIIRNLVLITPNVTSTHIKTAAALFLAGSMWTIPWLIRLCPPLAAVACLFHQYNSVEAYSVFVAPVVEEWIKSYPFFKKWFFLVEFLINDVHPFVHTGVDPVWQYMVFMLASRYIMHNYFFTGTTLLARVKNHFSWNVSVIVSPDILLYIMSMIDSLAKQAL